MKYRWVERTPALSAFGGDFDSPDEAIKWANEWRLDGQMTPEHAEIFLVEFNDSYVGIWRRNKQDTPTNLGGL